MMAASSLLGMPSSMKSHSFWFCYIWPAVRYLRSLTPHTEGGENVANEEPNGGDIIQNDLEFETDMVLDNSNICINMGEGSAKIYKIDNDYIPVHQHIHYMYRGEELATLNFLEYCGLISIRAMNETESSENNDPLQLNEVNELPSTRAGRKRNKSFRFNLLHPLYETHIQSLHSKQLIPILAGSPPPRLPPRCSEDTRSNTWKLKAQQFAEFYLALMIPWDLQACKPTSVSFDYEGLCQYMYHSQTSPTASFIDRCRANSINIKATCLIVDNRKKKVMTTWRARSSKLWSDKRKDDDVNADISLQYNGDCLDYAKVGLLGVRA